jgi:hypothetical protein
VKNVRFLNTVGEPGDRAFGVDGFCFDVRMHHITVQGGTGPTFEVAENCTMDGYTYEGQNSGSSTNGFGFGNCADCTLSNFSINRAGQYGMYVDQIPNVGAGYQGNVGCVVRDGTITASGAAGTFTGVAQDTLYSGVKSFGNAGPGFQTGASSVNTQYSNCSARKNGSTGWTDSGSGTQYKELDFADNTPDSGTSVSGINITPANSKLVALRGVYGSVPSAGYAISFGDGGAAPNILLDGFDIELKASASQGVLHNSGTTIRSIVRNGHINFTYGAAGWGYGLDNNVAGGSMAVDHVRIEQTGGSTGVVGIANSGTSRIDLGPGVDVDSCSTPISDGGGPMTIQQTSGVSAISTTGGAKTLTVAQMYNACIETTGALGSSDTTIAPPNALPGWEVVLRNNNTGAHNTGILVGGTTINVGQGKAATIRINGSGVAERVTADT